MPVRKFWKRVTSIWIILNTTGTLPYDYTESLLWKIIVKREDTGLKRQGHAVLANALVLGRNARRRQISLIQAHISLIFDTPGSYAQGGLCYWFSCCFVWSYKPFYFTSSFEVAWYGLDFSFESLHIRKVIYKKSGVAFLRRLKFSILSVSSSFSSITTLYIVNAALPTIFYDYL